MVIVNPQESPPFLQGIFSCVKRVALSRFHSISQRESFAQLDVRPEGPYLGYWLGLILVSGPGCRIVFKCFFSAEDVRKVAANVYAKRPEDISLRQSHDFVREFCNLTAGGLVKLFGNQGVSLGISLPIIIRGFDDIFYDAVSDSIRSYEDVWSVSDGSSSFVFGALVEIIDPNIFNNVNFNMPDETSNEVDFF